MIRRLRVLAIAATLAVAFVVPLQVASAHPNVCRTSYIVNNGFGGMPSDKYDLYAKHWYLSNPATNQYAEYGDYHHYLQTGYDGYNFKWTFHDNVTQFCGYVYG